MPDATPNLGIRELKGLENCFHPAVRHTLAVAADSTNNGSYLRITKADYAAGTVIYLVGGNIFKNNAVVGTLAPFVRIYGDSTAPGDADGAAVYDHTGSGADGPATFKFYREVAFKTPYPLVLDAYTAATLDVHLGVAGFAGPRVAHLWTYTAPPDVNG